MNAMLCAAMTTAAALACATVDNRTGLIPNRITYPTAVILSALAAYSGRLEAATLGVLWTGGTLLGLHLLTRGRGLGAGDVKLGACIGVGFGAPLGMIALGVSFVAGGAVGTWALVTKRAQRKDSIRFGPYLAFGSISGLVAMAMGWTL